MYLSERLTYARDIFSHSVNAVCNYIFIFIFHTAGVLDILPTAAAECQNTQPSVGCQVPGYTVERYA